MGSRPRSSVKALQDRLGTKAAGLGLGALLSACVFVPVTTEVYDPDCQIVTRQMELRPVQVSALGQCHGADDCGGMLVLFGATAAASAVVSGSIVIVGNVAYWFEKQGRCTRER